MIGAHPSPPTAVDDEIRAWFRADRSRMTMMAARKFAVPERSVVEALVGQWPIVRLRDGAFRGLMEGLPGLGPMRVFVRSRAAVIESVGDLRRLLRVRPVLQRPDRHARHAHPPRRGRGRSTPSRRSGTTPTFATHSFQFFDRDRRRRLQGVPLGQLPRRPGRPRRVVPRARPPASPVPEWWPGICTKGLMPAERIGRRFPVRDRYDSDGGERRWPNPTPPRS